MKRAKRQQRSRLIRSIYGAARKVRRYIIAESRHLRILQREFRFSIWALVFVLSIGTTLVHYYYPREHGLISWGEALHHNICAIVANPLLNYPENTRLAIFFLIEPIFGLLLLADTVARLGSLLFQRRSQNKEWQILLASTYSNHVIVCGLGHVGYRVVKNLVRNEMECVVIELKENQFVQEIRSLGVPVILADARHQEVMIKANLAEARAVIVTTDDDLANLEVALDVRSIRPDIRIVMRLFDEQLANKIAKGFNIQCAFSTSAIAAPVFAAAVTERNVINSFVFNDVQLNTVEITISDHSRLIGWTLDRLRSELEITVALYRTAKEMDWNPNPAIVLQAGVKLLVITTSESLRELEQLNRAPKQQTARLES